MTENIKMLENPFFAGAAESFMSVCINVSSFKKKKNHHTVSFTIIKLALPAFFSHSSTIPF
jgi:hypothetical protein